MRVGERRHRQQRLRLAEQLVRERRRLRVEAVAVRAALERRAQRLASVVALAAELEGGGLGAGRDAQRVDARRLVGGAFARDKRERRLQEGLGRPRRRRSHANLHRRAAHPGDAPVECDVVEQVGSVAVHDAIDARRHEQQVLLARLATVLKGDRAGQGVEILEQPADTDVAPRVAIRVRQLQVGAEWVRQRVGRVDWRLLDEGALARALVDHHLLLLLDLDTLAPERVDDWCLVAARARRAVVGREAAQGSAQHGAPEDNLH